MFTLPDISIGTNVAQAIAVIVAVLFGIVQLRQLAAQRRLEVRRQSRLTSSIVVESVVANRKRRV